MNVIGIDGWKTKWVGIEIADNTQISIHVFQSLQEVVAEKRFSVIAIDVPIGLPQVPPREADNCVRSKIGRRSSSVFASPPAFCLEKEWKNREELSDECKRRFNIGIGSQTYALLKNIREAHKIAVADERVFETHPEFTFCVMNSDKPLRFSKKSWNGISERKKLLKDYGIELPETIDAEAGCVAVDDLLDAASCAWTAKRIASKSCVALPDSKQRMERIWA